MRLLIDQAGLRSSVFAVATFSPVQILCFAAFLVAGGAIVYVLFGYPLLLGWIAKRHNHPVKKDDQLRSVSIIIAVRNGEKFIRRKLESVLALNYPRELVEIIVVSDGSDDRTDEIAREFEAQRVRLLRVPRGGKAVALNAAVPCASGEILIFTDVRQEVDPQALRNLIANFGDPGIGAVSGELAIVNDQTQEESDTSLALNAAVPCASGEILIFTDVRQEVDPQALRNLIANFGDPGIGEVRDQIAIVND